jgi:hypothetical protein
MNQFIRVHPLDPWLRESGESRRHSD